MSRELLKRVANIIHGFDDSDSILAEIDRELAKPEHEPLCYLSNKVGTTTFEQCEAEYGPPNNYWTSAIPVYVSPPPRKPLSDDEIDKLMVTDYSSYRSFARAIEKAHGIGDL